MKCILRKQVYTEHSDFCYKNEIKHYVYIIKLLMFRSQVIFFPCSDKPRIFSIYTTFKCFFSVFT